MITTTTRRRFWRSLTSLMTAIAIAFFVVSQIQLNLQAASSTFPISDAGAVLPVQEEEFIAGNATFPAKKSRLDAYNPSKYPVLVNVDVDTLPIKVGIVTISPLVGEAMHFLYDGVMRSEVLKLIGVVSLYGANDTDAAPEWEPQAADLWIVDGARVAKLKRPFLDRILHDPSPSWKVLIVDFSDQFRFQLRNYQRLKVWDCKHVRIAVRSIVQGRYYDSNTNTLVPGRIGPNLPTVGGRMLHVPYPVRSDIVDALQHDVLRLSDNSTATLARALFDTGVERLIDVLHPWNVSYREGKSKLRNNVSKMVRSWNGTLKVKGRPMVASIDEQGERRHVGRNAVDPNYIRALLSAKIVVVTQKDDWEDHYRLFESLCCGALVFHDAMVAPPKGLVNGDTIVFFKTLDELQERALHYLRNDEERQAVARKGFELAMGRHRSWHRMEELIFGRPLTLADLEYADL